MKRVTCFAIVAVVGWILASGSTGFSAPPKKAPPLKHGGGKPAHPAAKPQSKPKPHDAHKGAPNQNNGKEKENDKSKVGAHEEHKSDKLAKDDLHDHHEDIHPNLHGEHDTIENRTVNKTIGGSVNGGTAGAATGGDAGRAGDASGGPDVGGGGMTGRPQLFFGFNESERGRYDSAARAAGLNRDEWIRRTLNTAAGRELK
jgi:hypothetical protein